MTSTANSSRSSTASEIFDFDENKEMLELQNQNEKLHLKICDLKAQLENLELDKGALNEENVSLKEKIKNYEEYISQLEESGNNEIKGFGNIDNIKVDELTEEELKEKVIEYKSEIERLNEFIKEELLNNETSTKEYEQEIKSLKEEIKNNEDEAYHLKLEFGRVKEQNQKDIENLCNDYNNLKQEKEDNEQILNEKIAENFATVKNLENKLYQMEKSYQELSELSAKKLKETIDKYTDDIAKVREEAEKINKINSQTLEGIDITKLNKENYLLKSENIQLLADLRKYKNDVGVMQIQLNNQLCLQSSLTKTITEYKERINSLEELNDRLKSELFNVNLNGFSLKNIESNDENTAKFRESESKLVEELKEELKKNKEMLNVVINNSNFTFKVRSENKKLREEIFWLKKEREKLLKSKREANLITTANSKKSSEINNLNDNSKQVNFLKEQNKSFMSDIEKLNKSVQNLINKLKDKENDLKETHEKLIKTERINKSLHLKMGRQKLEIEKLKLEVKNK